MAAEMLLVSFLTLFILELVVGLSASLFIVGVILKETCQGKKMSPKNKVLLSLNCGHVSFSFLIFIKISKALLGFHLDLFVENLISALTLHFVYSGSFLTLCICFYCFFKIISFKSRFLSLVKMKIDVLIPWMIVVMEVLSLCFSFPYVILQVQDTPTSNQSVLFLSVMLGRSDISGRFPLSFMSGSFLLVIILMTFTVVFLTRHIRRMSSSSGNAKAQTAVKSLVNLLVFYVIFVSLMTIVLFSGLMEFELGKYIFHVIQFSYIPVQCGLVIYSDTIYLESCRATCMCRRFASLIGIRHKRVQLFGLRPVS